MVFQFVQLHSCVDASFWHKFAEIKLEKDRLSDSAKPIKGYYTNLADNFCCVLEVDFSAFNPDFQLPKNCYKSHGILLNKNTIEEFKTCNKKEILATESLKFWNNFESGRVLDDPSLISFFIILSFADLKAHNFYYWFAFPVPIEPVVNEHSSPKYVKDAFSAEQQKALQNFYFDPASQVAKNFFLAEATGSAGFAFFNLKDKISHQNRAQNFVGDNLERLYFCFSDPSSYDSPGWTLRMFLVLLMYYCPFLLGKTVFILSFRQKRNRSLERSLIFPVRLPEYGVKNPHDFNWVGWEKNQQDKFGPRLAAMEKTMNPIELSESSINLNLKLMKWRLAPNLDLDVIAATKCLLIGAGTLGCGVARSLLAWGVNQITLIDSGKVHFSNTVRQSLYTHEDALSGCKRKVSAAMQRLKEIKPNLCVEGHDIHIPMPDHPVGAAGRDQTLRDLDTLKRLVRRADIIFLLTDSRESRWLPTLLGAFYGKIVINAALGFDSYLVMRHGTRASEPSSPARVEVPGLRCIPGTELGCYFCNDVTAPGDSQKDRTLDQQCTVTRPAVSNIASSIAVELAVALLQHKDRAAAPAYCQQGGATSPAETRAMPEGILGILPHSVRGYLGTFEQIIPATERFPHCTACSEPILDAFGKGGAEFLLRVFESSKCLEDIAGISEMMIQVQNVEDFYLDEEFSD